ncbi:hypothetical protein [Bythopirellula polymerisocia]|uniref:Uncharacterized protein n=1 Tax=Bythopirellula polymerisocia TaxID=2528003 RepID=A0A5C6CGX8_9BACT|nr:hypothetical protein [Bythopirellula polymerisocia]TWU22824.1 hypothetical protein Pla144_42850 [Bythopirellula polymerisocia]
MFIPRFTLLTTLKWVTVCALFCVVLAHAAAGSYWATALSVAVLSVVVILLVQAFTFVIIAAFSKVFGKQQLPARTPQGGIQTNPDERYLPGKPTTERSP